MKNPLKDFHDLARPPPGFFFFGVRIRVRARILPINQLGFSVGLMIHPEMGDYVMVTVGRS